MKKISIISICIFFMSVPVYALNFENSHTYRYDIRGDDGGDIYLVQATLKSTKPIKRINRDLTLGVFVQGKYTFDSEDFEMSKLGGLVGLEIIKWLSIVEDIYYVEKKDDFIWRSRLITSIPFKIFDLKPSLKILQEFRFNLDEGEGSRSDTGVGINLPITDIFSCYLGWRHADRIHSFDTDYVETKLTLTF